MTHKPARLFDFVLRQGKISPELSGATAHFYFRTYGLPLEEYMNEFKELWAEMTPEAREARILQDLQEWHKEGKPIVEYVPKK